LPDQFRRDRIRRRAVERRGAQHHYDHVRIASKRVAAGWNPGGRTIRLARRALARPFYAGRAATLRSKAVKRGNPRLKAS
jgi:hypothetical protein